MGATLGLVGLPISIPNLPVSVYYRAIFRAQQIPACLFLVTAKLLVFAEKNGFYNLLGTEFELKLYACFCYKLGKCKLVKCSFFKFILVIYKVEHVTGYKKIVGQKDQVRKFIYG